MGSMFINFLIYSTAGLFIGGIFGFLLQKGGVSDFNTIVGQFLFKNITVLQIMLSAIILGGTLLYSLVSWGLIPLLPLKASSMYGSIIGGIIFGAGMAILGYCPGTALAALGQGARDALFGILGMFTGIIIFEKCYNLLKKTVLIDTPSQVTLPVLFNSSALIIFIVLAISLIIMSYLFKLFKKST